MSVKMTCPGCGMHGSSVADNFMRGEPCRECRLPNATAVQIVEVRERYAESELATRCTDLLVQLGHARAERDLYLARLTAVREALNGGDE